MSDLPTHHAPLPTHRGRRTLAAIDATAAVIARQGILAATASLYNYGDSKEAMGREGALRHRDEVGERANPVARQGLSPRERVQQAAAAHGQTYKNRLAEMVSVSQLTTLSPDFAQYWAEICLIPTSFIAETVRRAQADGYCDGEDRQLIADDDARTATLATIYYRTIYDKEGR